MKQLNKLIFTKHAFARMHENGLTIDKVLDLWNNAKEEIISEKRMMYKFLKYDSKRIRTTKYYISENYQFTIGLENPKSPVVITITKLNENTKKI